MAMDTIEGDTCVYIICEQDEQTRQNNPTRQQWWVSWHANFSIISKSSGSFFWSASGSSYMSAPLSLGLHTNIPAWMCRQHSSFKVTFCYLWLTKSQTSTNKHLTSPWLLLTLMMTPSIVLQGALPILQARTNVKLHRVSLHIPTIALLCSLALRKRFLKPPEEQDVPFPQGQILLLKDAMLLLTLLLLDVWLLVLDIWLVVAAAAAPLLLLLSNLEAGEAWLSVILKSCIFLTL